MKYFVYKRKMNARISRKSERGTSRWKFLLLLIILGFLLSFTAGTGTADPLDYIDGPSMVKDIYPNDAESLPSDLTQVGDVLFFTADDGIHGRELWKSDGTEEGTAMVKDICSEGCCTSDPQNLTNVNGTLFFTADDGERGRELWKSDGTPEGTVMVKDIATDELDSSDPSSLTNVNGTLFFAADDGIHGRELWKSDGTVEGTVMVKDINLSGESVPEELTNVNGTLFFTANNGTNKHGRELWKSDGTEEGTFMVKDIWDSGMPSTPMYLTEMNNKLYFSADDGIHKRELWVSDGTPEGTVMVKNICSEGISPRYLTNVNGTLFFNAFDADHHRELWKSDGTKEGTFMVKDIWPGGCCTSNPQNLTNVNGILFFTANDYFHGRELWISDGDPNGTFMVKDIAPAYLDSSDPSSLTNLYGALFFSAFDPNSQRELWRSDGTEEGTVMVKDIWPGGVNTSNPQNLTNFFIEPNNYTLYFSANDGTLGDELWKSDGTEEGTVMVKDINSSGLNPSSLIKVNSTLYFSANDGTHGHELWKSDGTGTFMVKDINASGCSDPTFLADVNGTLFFTADDGIHGRELWLSDGTVAGTFMVKDINANGCSDPSFLADVNGTLFFVSDNGTHGLELWKSDGTEAGTVMVKDINPAADESKPEHLTNVNGTLFFTANKGTLGRELWKSDGTEAGTVMVKDINPAADESKPEHLTNVNGTLFFTANKGTLGRELWKSDGTATGTVMVKDIYPGAYWGSWPRNLTSVNGTLFFSANDGTHGNELWKSDGTEEGTVMVKDIRTELHSSDPSSLTNVNGTLFFCAIHPDHHRELWKSGGTEESTVMVKDIWPGGCCTSSPQNLTNVNGILFFTANDYWHGRELWVSDGTEEGTVMVEDLAPGLDDSIDEDAPFPFTVISQTVFFPAQNLNQPNYVGRELWKITQTNSPPTITAIENQKTYDNHIIGPLAFTIDDAQTYPNELTVEVTSSDSNVLPKENIALSGSGRNRMVTLTPSDNQIGTAIVTITVSDEVYTTTRAFTVEWYEAYVVGSSIDNGIEYTTIQDAVAAAPDGGVILLTDGVYKDPYEDDPNKNMNILLDGTKNLIIRSENGPENTIIDLEYKDRAFTFTSGNSSTLDGLKIINGSTDYYDYNGGGAILIRDSSPVIKNCTFSRNYARNFGGAISVIYNATENGNFEIAGCNFSNNCSYIGGAIMIRPSNPNTLGDGNSIIRNSSFSRNTAKYSGGAVYDTGFSVITCCSFSHNQGLAFGGAVNTVSGRIINSTFLENKSRQGGAICARDCENKNETTSVAHCTFASNKAGAGGALYAQQNVDVSNSILWGNRAEDGGNQIYLSASSEGQLELSIEYSDLEGGLSAIGETDSNSVVSSRGGMIDVNPDFALGEDLYLLPDSPCIDAGTNNPDNQQLRADTDKDGNIRPLDGSGNGFAMADMGAYEFDRAQYPVAAISPAWFVFTAREGGMLPERQTLYISNRGLVALDCEVNEDISWLRIEVSESSSTDGSYAARLYADQAGLKHGVYSGTITIKDKRGTHALRTVQVTLYVTRELYVQADYPTIQKAINATIEGDVVVVEEGTYKGKGNKDLDFLGKAITVRSANGPEYTTIDCENDDRAFWFRRDETPRSILQGFTITNGRNRWGGAGVYIGVASSPTILDCIFVNNVCFRKGAEWMLGGSAILTEGVGVTIRNCTFKYNTCNDTWSEVKDVGGAVYIIGEFTTIDNCSFYENYSTYYSGAIYFGAYAKFCTIKNCKFTDNKAQYGGAIGVIKLKSTPIDYQKLELTVSGCVFLNNRAETKGGAIYDCSCGLSNIYNCLFIGNSVTDEGAIYFDTPDTTITNCTFYANTSNALGRGIYSEHGGIFRITNSILYKDDIYIGTNSSCDISYSAIQEGTIQGDKSKLTQQHIIFIDANDLLFINEEEDFRLHPSSPCIDAGKKIPWLFSDIRGSLRPVDVPNMPRNKEDGKPLAQYSAFDIGAYEYSEDYGGFAGDLPTKAFKELKTGGSLVVTDFEYKIEWKDRDPFPYDTRIHNSGSYDVRVALVNDQGLRIDLGTYTVQVSQQGYSIPYAFGAQHIGTWRIRLELVSDSDQFVLSDEISIEYKEATRYALSQWIKPPEGAYPGVKPDVAEKDACYWSVETNRLYAIAPITTVVTWYADEERTIPLPVVAYITYPDQKAHFKNPDTQIHIADSMPVDLLAEGTTFDLVEILYADNDATMSANKFTAGQEGWAVLMYRDQQADNPDEKEKFDVVRTYAWDHTQDPLGPDNPILNPHFPIELSWEIGTEITDPDHCPVCGSGYVFFEVAPYDGYGEMKAYDREVRQGPIFAVNEDDPQTEQDDLVIVWYKKSTASDVCWPSKPLRYDTHWPDDARKIVIASGLGSGPLHPSTYSAMENMLIYNQPDRTKPGYNANEEHAAFFTAQGSEYPGIFPLRTDLNKPTDREAPYQSEDRSRPYVLLKYQDPDIAEWAFEVFEVVAQSEGYVVEGNAAGTRYYIDGNGSLLKRFGYQPDESYYINAQGHLVNPADDVEMCYNYNETTTLVEEIDCLPLDGVKEHYIATNGALRILDPASPPSEPYYYLDEHGVLVDPDVYYRFHYAGTAGQEINPPYPVNQLTFGPCSESYTSTPMSVLEDKDNKFFAKHGGYSGHETEDVVLHYFYRLQTGFWYDLDDNGVPDEAAGTPLAWLEALDETFDNKPMPITYSIRWPDPVPTLHVGETLLDAKTQEGETVGLPKIKDQCIVKVLFDQPAVEGGSVTSPDYTIHSVNLINPLKEYSEKYILGNPKNELPQDLKPRYSLSSGRWMFTALPYHLQVRLTYDPVAGFEPATGESGELKLKGYYTTGTGEPTLLLNTLTSRDIAVIENIVKKEDFLEAVKNLKQKGDDALAYPKDSYPELMYSERKALTAGDARGTGYVTLAFNNHVDCPAPTMLCVIKVDCPLYTGEIKVIESENPFEEKLTLRHNGDFGGNSDERWFQWKYLPADFSGIPVGPGQPNENWQNYFAVVPSPETSPEKKDPNDDVWFYMGAEDVTVQGTGQQLLPDKWFSVRYFYDTNEADPDDICPVLSAWTKPQLYEGWIKRVMKKINLFDQKVKVFHASDVNTLASMIAQAGSRYEGAVALSDDPEYLQNLGIIEVYETLLERGGSLIGEDGDYTDINKALLFAANRLANLYMLLGNEAYGDAADPTIGFSTKDGQYGTEAPSIFCFQNQVDSLLEEELVLMRGRDDEGVRPFYNRLIWNFTLGDGEVAYKENYNITDQATDQDGDGFPDAMDGEVNEYDAMVLYPQGHGDAWGHYLMAVKKYYSLLKAQNFTWIPQSEAILVAGTPVEVDYRDERKFASAAVAKAKAGSEIVNLTYRQYYIEDPEGQWQGYKDLDPVRAWGVDGWTRRTGQGVLFDWVVGNAILPPEDTEHEGIAKVDRSTVVELQEVASQYNAVQAEVDRADVGLNPLGLAKHAVPFDIDPGGIANGQTHFEQIYDRAVQAMNNAIAVFNHANQSTMLLRRQQDTLADFKRNIENSEADFNNRLIEVFGYPYSDDCGPGKTYSTDYAQTGPDLYHYMYVDPSELMGVEAPRVHEWVQKFRDIKPDASGAFAESIKEVSFHVDADSRFGLIKPPEWQGRRKSPGEIHLARSDLLQGRGRFEKALIEYDNLLGHIEKQADLIKAQYNLNREEIYILNRQRNENIGLDVAIFTSRALWVGFRTIGNIALMQSNAVAEGFPKTMGVIAGFSCGTIMDPLAPARSAAKILGVSIQSAMSIAVDAQSLVELGCQQAKDIIGLQTNIELTTKRGEFAVEQQLLQLENLIRTEATLRLEIYNLAESMQQSAGRYLSALARGDRLLRDRMRFRRQTAAQIQDYRYKDMAFRIFRNDALQKYRAQFDMAARYVYLAAKAYDYETTLLDYDNMAGQAFLTDIVRQRTIGLIEGGLPLTGTGLADPMKRMWQNFQVLKPQLGFNNPQEETNRFSLRRELFRIMMDEGSNGTWRQALEECRVNNLWDMPEFRRYCRYFADEGMPQPGIVIPFSTTVTSGLNFFEWPLGGKDSYYSATNFATKVRSVGIWLSNYNSVQLAQTPRIYLVPVGEDVLRTPSYYTKDIRTWQVVDQKLPVPFPIMNTELENNPGWIPTVDTIFDEMFRIRRHSDFRAYHDSGYVNESEMTFDSRLVGRSVWNTGWLLIIPGQGLLYDQDEGLERFINGPQVIGGNGERTGNGVSDIKLFFHTYSYSGN